MIKPKLTISNLLLFLLACCIALGWFIDRRNLSREVSDLRSEQSKLSVAHKDKRIRRQNVLKLIAEQNIENIPALIAAMADEDIQIALEARAGLEVLTNQRFRKNAPKQSTKRDLYALLENEQTQWLDWFASAKSIEQ